MSQEVRKRRGIRSLRKMGQEVRKRRGMRSPRKRSQEVRRRRGMRKGVGTKRRLRIQLKPDRGKRGFKEVI